MNLSDIFMAPEESLLKAISEYVAMGGDINAKAPTSKWSLLHLAAQLRNEGAILLLIDLEADLNAQDGHGWTPLHHAVDADVDQANQAEQEIDLSITQLLIQHGIDQTIKDLEGKTPRDIAADYGQEVLSLYDQIATP